MQAHNISVFQLYVLQAGHQSMGDGSLCCTGETEANTLITIDIVRVDERERERVPAPG